MTWLQHPATLTAIVFAVPALLAGAALFVRELRIERAHRILNSATDWADVDRSAP